MKVGKKNYEKYAYINFDANDRMKQLFSGNFDIDRIIQGLKLESGVNIEAKNTLIIFDEVQETPKALTALKYFCEKMKTISYYSCRFFIRNRNT